MVKSKKNNSKRNTHHKKMIAKKKSNEKKKLEKQNNNTDNNIDNNTDNQLTKQTKINKIFKKIDDIYFIDNFIDNNKLINNIHNTLEITKQDSNEQKSLYESFKHNIEYDEYSLDISLLIIKLIDYVKRKKVHIVYEFEFLIKDNTDYYDYYQLFNILTYLTTKYRYVFNIELRNQINNTFKIKFNKLANFDSNIKVPNNKDALEKLFYQYYKYDKDYFTQYVHKSYYETPNTLKETKIVEQNIDFELLKEEYKYINKIYNSINNKQYVKPLFKPVLNIDDELSNQSQFNNSSDTKHYSCGYKINTLYKNNSEISSDDDDYY